MIIKLPTLKREIVDGEMKKTRGEITVEIDTSFLAHLKWEEHFEEQLKCSLTQYTERVSVWSKNKDAAMANFLGALKLLYCYVHSPELPIFKDFVKLFDYEIAEEILEKLADVLNEASKFAAKK